MTPCQGPITPRYLLTRGSPPENALPNATLATTLMGLAFESCADWPIGR
jgi:hypothetical protein